MSGSQPAVAGTVAEAGTTDLNDSSKLATNTSESSGPSQVTLVTQLQGAVLSMLMTTYPPNPSSNTAACEANEQPSDTITMASCSHVNGQTMDISGQHCTCPQPSNFQNAGYKQSADFFTSTNAQPSMNTPPDSEVSTPAPQFSAASSPTLGSPFIASANPSIWASQSLPSTMLTPPTIAEHQVYHPGNTSSSDDDLPSIAPLSHDINMGAGSADTNNEEAVSTEDVQSPPPGFGQQFWDQIPSVESGNPENAYFEYYPSSEDHPMDTDMTEAREGIPEPDFSHYAHPAPGDEDLPDTIYNGGSDDGDTEEGLTIHDDTETMADDGDTEPYDVSEGLSPIWGQWSKRANSLVMISSFYYAHGLEEFLYPRGSKMPEPSILGDHWLEYIPFRARSLPAGITDEPLKPMTLDPWESPVSTDSRFPSTHLLHEYMIDLLSWHRDITDLCEVLPLHGWHPMDPQHFIPTTSGYAVSRIDPCGNANLPLNYRKDFETNMDFSMFMRQLYLRTAMPEGTFDGPGPQALTVNDWKRPKEILAEDINGDCFDIQGIDWEIFGITRDHARQYREKFYKNYTNLKHNKMMLDQYTSFPRPTENFVKFRRTSNLDIAHLAHFQLRNLVCATSKNDVYYAGKSVLYHANPFTKTTQPIMQCLGPEGSIHASGIKISTMSATHGVGIVGCFGGEYAMCNLEAEYGSPHIEGIVTTHDNGITNHVHTFQSRTNNHPYAVFSSNDQKIRIMDCYTNKFLKEHPFNVPINCSATSPDARLRVVVGDHTRVLIVDAETGQAVQELDGHTDFGFACAWADDGRHVATGNQDMQVRIYDARNWSRPLSIIASEMAGCRSLRFSPVGGGKRVLVIAEPADFVSVVDAELFETKQRIDFFGEIGGVSFTPDGRELFIANMDRKVGGLMEFERTGFGAQYGMRDWRRREMEAGGVAYRSELGTFDWLEDDELGLDSRVLIGGKARKRRGMTTLEEVYW